MSIKKPRKPKPGNSLAEAHPDVADEWHPHKNGTMSPGDVTRRSAHRAWWVCTDGHEWEATVAKRTNGTGCPVCSGRQVLPGFNSLEDMEPAIAAQWHPHKNGTTTPRDVTRSSNRKVWWQCSLGHEWEATVSSRTNMGSGCPDCPRKPKPGNSLAEARPDVAEQWYPGKNGDLTPRDVTRGSRYRAWWVCPNGHEWEATVSDRTNTGSGCPVCAGKQVLPGFNSLEDTDPAVAAQWHPHKNGSTTPRDVTRSSEYRAWWVCIEGHEWPALVSSRSSGCGCPVCSGNQVLPGFNSLADMEPALAKEWHPHKNGTMSPQDVTRSSNRKVWWRCSLGHEWEARVAGRTGGSGCPRCVDWGTSKPEQLLRRWFTNSPFVTDVHPDEHVRVETSRGIWLVDIVGRLADVPSDIHPGVAIEYDGKYWHEQADAVERDLRKTQDLLEAGYLVVRVREHDLPHLDLRHPNLLQVTYGDPLNTNWETFELVKMLDSFFQYHRSLYI